MYMIREATNTGPTPIYLVSGDLVIWLQDTDSVWAFLSVGIPQLGLSPQEITDIVRNLTPAP